VIAGIGWLDQRFSEWLPAPFPCDLAVPASADASTGGRIRSTSTCLDNGGNEHANSGRRTRALRPSVFQPGVRETVENAMWLGWSARHQ